MKKSPITLLLAGALYICALSGCSPQGGGDATAAPVQTDAPGVTNDTAAPDAPAEPSGTLSVPVKMTADGDVDMDAALSYETDFDALQKQLDARTVSDDHPVSENSNPETVALYQYLKENYGKKVFSGQMLGDRYDKEDIAYYYHTGDLPAMKGFDFIFKTTPNGDGSDWTQMAIDWHTKSGGIVMFCWHWNVPCRMDDPDSTAEAFYTEGAGNPYTTFDIEKAVTPGTEEYKVAVHDIDLIAHELQRLEAAGVPVLWRPLHEASGKWFWWGMKDRTYIEKQLYQKLWYMIYDRLENYHKLTNLIWVWNGQSKYLNVHPNTYDIAGVDVYPNNEDHSVLAGDYKKLAAYTDEGKMLALTECGYILDPEDIEANLGDVKWLYYMPWNFDFIYKGSTVVGIPRLNTERVTSEFMKKVMTSDTIITWSELPAFEGTEKQLPEQVQAAMPDMDAQRAKDAELAAAAG